MLQPVLSPTLPFLVLALGLYSPLELAVPTRFSTMYFSVSRSFSLSLVISQSFTFTLIVSSPPQSLSLPSF